VLTGVNLNQYAAGGRDLGGLLAFLLEGTGRIALRLSSLEPEGITPPLLEVLAHPRIRPHFHLSVQSGSLSVLERMGRPYTPEAVEAAVAALRQAQEDPFLACDIIAGFPGESPEDFEASRELCRRAGFAWIHAFPYSPRPGTGAFDFKNPVPGREAAARVERLLALGRRGRREYLGRWAGRTVEAVVEGGGGRALSANYLKLLLSPPPVPPAPGSAVRCRIAGEAPPGSGFDALAVLAD
jgi:threonylcarbamoyladenosine tRNA methylthiotransferase MtaB